MPKNICKKTATSFLIYPINLHTFGIFRFREFLALLTRFQIVVKNSDFNLKVKLFFF